MIEGIHPVAQAALGTLFTWGLTAAGAALVFVFQKDNRLMLDTSLGFAAGVMTAASFWSLLAPALEMAEESGLYGKEGEYSCIPVSVGFLLGAMFVYASDIAITRMNLTNPLEKLAHESRSSDSSGHGSTYQPFIPNFDTKPAGPGTVEYLRKRGAAGQSEEAESGITMPTDSQSKDEESSKWNSWKRMLLLIVAITVHNIPEGMAVGVAFASIGKTASCTFNNARNLALGIGIQNFPEGLAVSLPLRGAGFSLWQSFWYGQLSGAVEPIAGVLGALAVSVMEPALPYALAFAAGAMIYVVADDIIPEANAKGNGRYASWGMIVGFLVMMILDVSLG